MPAVTTGDESGTTDTGPTTLPTTTVDPDGTTTDRPRDTDTDPSATMGATETSGAECGNDIAEDGEDCDGTDLAGQDCILQGFDEGDLGCAADCTFDTTACVMYSCGNDLLEGAEVCDGADLGGEDCLTQGFDEGTLGCSRDCGAFDTSGCVMYSCGNDLLEGIEVCDGAELDGETCLTMGFDEGTLACAGDCLAYDTSGCVMYSCGNDLLEGIEVCDGSALAGQDCITQGFDEGVLDCAVDCMAFDTSGCASCGDGTIGGTETCDGADLAGQTCVSQGFDGGTLGCALDCGAFDTSGCEQCGNDVIEGVEVCDGTALGGQTCTSLGFQSGVLGCSVDCGSIDTSGCCSGTDIGSAVGIAVASGTNVGEGDDQQTTCTGTAGEDVVFFWTAPATETFTIDTLGSDYDTVVAVLDDCGGTELGCNDQAFGTNQSSMTLDATVGTTYAIVVDGWNGSTGSYLLNISESFGACTDIDVGNDTGTPVVNANDVSNVGAVNDTQGSCTVTAGEDVAYQWIAPASGTFQIDTVNSDYDTVLYLLDGCGGNEIDCNDDFVGLQSGITFTATAGVPYVIVVDAFNNATGLHDLNIEPIIAICSDIDVGGVMGTPIALGNNVGAFDDAQPTCTGTPGEDVVYQWTSPITGDVVIDTFGSDYDTVLYVLDDCGGTELACNDDTGGGQSSVTIAATAGTTYQVVVDGWNGSTGNIVLSINPALAACADGTIGTSRGTPVAQGSNVGAGDDLQGTCTGTPGEDVAVQWVAPATGTYTVDTFNSDFDTMVYVTEGCGGLELACNDQAAGTNQSSVTFDAVAGTEYILVVDGWNGNAGNFDLNVTGPF